MDVVLPSGNGFPTFEDSSEAGAVILAVGRQGPPELRYPLDVDNRLARLLTVRLDAAGTPWAEPSPGTLDLTDWSGGDSPELERLTSYIRTLLEHDRTYPLGTPTLEDPWVMTGATQGVSGLARLTDQVGALVEVLSDDAEHSRQLRTALREVGATYRIVETALESFLAAGVDPKGVHGETFAELERGLLAQAIVNGRGHCGRIATQYTKVNGVRDSVKDRIPPELLNSMDATFAELGTADGDLFAAMDNLGEALTGESQIIVRHLLTGREDLARERIADAHEKLLPLEGELNTSLAAFQVIEGKLGYAEPTPDEGGGVAVSISSINIGGSVYNSNVVAAEIIKNSSLTATSATVNEELKTILTELHKAVAALTVELPDDEAERAAQDLKELTEEATKPTPRPAFWRRAAEGLMASAKKVVEVGTPVVALVTKVVELI